MVERSGNESIVRYDRERIRGYRILGLAMLFLAVITPVMIDDLVESAYYAVPVAFLALRMYQAGGAFSQAFVAIGPDGVRLRLLGRKWLKLIPLRERRFKWEEIVGITWDGAFCRFRAADHVYTLGDLTSPSPPTVAQLMAERKGVQLPAQKLLVPPGKRPIPRLTQAAILGGISLPLIGVVVAGGFWMYSHSPPPFAVGGPYYTAVFLTILVLGVLGGTLFLTAIVLILIEVNHRF